MRLSDIMSHAGLSRYAEIALVIFFLAFLGIVVWTFWPSRRAEMDHASRMPLDDDSAPSPPEVRS